MQSFIEAYLDYTKEFESPHSFFRWSAYATISAVCRDNVFRQQGDTLLFPNIYVVLLADSAVHRKNRPTNLSGDLIAEIKNTKVIRGRSSIQAILMDLSQSETNKQGRIQAKGGSCVICSEELSASIVEDPAAVKILTDIYDYKKEYTVNLKGTGKQVISNVVTTLLAGSNETLLKEVYTDAAVFGGLLGRTFLIKPDEFRKSNSLMRSEPDKFRKDSLLESLRKISELRGQIKIEDSAIEEFEKWYDPFRRSQEKRTDRGGVAGRIHTGIEKIAMILAINRYELNIRKSDVEEAIERCLALIPNYESFMMGTGKVPWQQAGAFLIQDLWKNSDHRVTKKEFLQRNWTIISNEDFDRLTITLENAGLIKIHMGVMTEIFLTPEGIKKCEESEQKVRKEGVMA